MNATEAANTLKFIADDHPCCAVALASIIAWLESLCPNCNAERTYYDGWHCPWELLHEVEPAKARTDENQIDSLRNELAKTIAERDGIFRELELTEMQVVMLKNRLAVKCAYEFTQQP